MSEEQHTGAQEQSQTQKSRPAQKSTLSGASVLGVGVGAAVGTVLGDLGNGSRVGAIIGVSLRLLIDSLRS